MKVISNIPQMHNWSLRMRQAGKSIGFVPTMGYLHQGHLSLLRRCRLQNDLVVLSIFVNPAQFGPKEDLRRYPRDFSRDKQLAELAGTDVIFYPQAKQMYPADYKTYILVEGLSDSLCGCSRPGHFRGVATVVLKLFNLICPDVAYFGQKDAQQALIIERMVKDLNLSTRIKVLPIIRQKDGLAMSSRNSYLNQQQKAQAKILYKALQVAVDMIKSGNKAPRDIIARMSRLIKTQTSARIDYIKIVDLRTLNEVKNIQTKVLIALAVYFGKTRLIDNVII